MHFSYYSVLTGNHKQAIKRTLWMTLSDPLSRFQGQH